MSGARQGRRRRVLQEEVLSASRELAAYAPADAENSASSEGRRYAFDEGSLGGALARRHLPARLIAPVLVLAVSTFVVAGLATAHEYRSAIAAQLGDPFAAMFDATGSHSLATWMASASMICASLLAVTIWAVRRRRVDDYHGRHRLWRGAILASLLLSVDAVTNLHTAAADAISTLSGIRLMSGGSEWWLVIGSAMFGWVGARVLLDVKESKLALAVLVGAVFAAGVAVIGPMAGVGGVAAPLVAKLAQLSCYLLIVTSFVCYARFLRVDVADGVASKPQRSRTAELKIAKETASSPAKRATPVTSEGSESKQKSQTRRKQKQANLAEQQQQDASQWTDGSDGYADDYADDSVSRRLSKSERKRLRKQKAQRRAA